MYGDLKRLEDQIVAGDGAGENIEGLLHTTGLSDTAFDAGVPLGELLLSGAVDTILSNATPSAVIVNPSDWRAVITEKSTGDGQYLRAQDLIQQPVIQSAALPAGIALVGDFNQAQVLVREGVNVRVSDSDQDDFVRGQVTLLAEGRFAFVVWDTTAFAVVHLAA